MGDHITDNYEKIMAQYLEYRNDLTDSTREVAHGAIPHLFDWLEGRSITPETVQGFYDALSKSHNGGTAEKIAKHVGWFCQWLHAMSYLKIDPSLGAKRPKITIKKVLTAYSKEEYLTLKKGLRKPYNDIVTILWHTGMSNGDAVELKWSEINMQDMMILKSRKKMRTRGGALQRIPIIEGTELLRVIWQRLKNRNPKEEWVFPELVVKTRQANETAIKLGCLDLGVPWRGTHGFRRAVCSALANEPTMNLLHAAQVSGHRDPKTLRDKYFTINHHKLRESVANALKDHFDGTELSRKSRPDTPTTGVADSEGQS